MKVMLLMPFILYREVQWGSLLNKAKMMKNRRGVFGIEIGRIMGMVMRRMKRRMMMIVMLMIVIHVVVIVIVHHPVVVIDTK